MDPYIQEEFIGSEQSTPISQTINNTSTLVSAAKKRNAISIKNTSTGGQVISIMFSNFLEATDGAGIVLQPNEGFIDSNSEGYKVWTGRIKAISDVAGGTIAIFER
jgi:hypothetical protein